MESDETQPRQLGVGHRLDAPPSGQLVAAFGSELTYAGVLYEGLSYADLAHAVMLIERGVIPGDPGRQLLEALVALHDGGLASVPLDAKWGDLYNNRDAELQRRLGRGAGWLHAGRARREALTIGWLLHLRVAGVKLLTDALHLVDTIADLAEQHVETLMPDFTYLQHAHPTTLGHYLLGFAYPVLRDAERLERELHYVSCSPAGSASTNGSRLPLERERMRELLGFEALAVHNRDAMWQPDLVIALMALIVSLSTTADRLAEELQIWATAEFDFVDFADEHCRTSVIMPNKKNPYAATFIRGRARELLGNLVSVVATNQTPSGQIDNRNAAYELLPEGLATSSTVLSLLDEVLQRATFNRDRLRKQAEEGGTWGTELADLLMQRERIDSRTAHDIVGKVVAAQRNNAVELATAIAEAFRGSAGRALRTAPADLVAELAPDRIVRTRTSTGGCAPEAVRAMCTALTKRTAELRAAAAHRQEEAQFPARLRAAVSEQLGRKW